MQLNPALLGAIRYVLSIGLWAGFMAILTFMSDATHWAPFVDAGTAVVLAGVVGAIEQAIEAKYGRALLGVVRTR